MTSVKLSGKPIIVFRFPLLLFCVLLSSCAKKEPVRLALSAIFKNEAPWLKEWVSYHHLVLGVDQFYLYNNESTDNFKEVLQPFVDQGIVEWIDWDSSNPDHLRFGAFMDAPWSAAQLGAYNDCLKNRALGKADWVGMIDIDEFIVPQGGAASFYDLLRKAKKRKKGTVSIHWRVFGTSDVERLREGELLTEKLTWRSSDDDPWNARVKSFHRPEAVSFALVHTAGALVPGFGSKTFSKNQVTLHHYWTRDEKYCLQKRGLSKEEDPEFFLRLHRVKDETILQYLHSVSKN
jgi:hypothetical protein